MQIYKEKDDIENFRLPRKTLIDLRKCTNWKVLKIDNSIQPKNIFDSLALSADTGNRKNRRKKK